MKCSKLIHISLTKLKGFGTISLNPLFPFFRDSSKCGSHFEHQFNFLFFDNHIGKDQFAKMSKAISSALPIVDLRSGYFRKLLRSVFSHKSSEDFHQPIYKLFFSGRNLKKCLEIFVSRFRGLRMISNVNTPFSIDYASKICKIFNCVLFSSINIYNKKALILDYGSIIQDKE